MTDFETRLHQAIQRGESRNSQRAKAARQEQMTEAQFKTLHGKQRLQLSEHIEECLKKLPDHFPGFQYETVYGEKGWGAACSRDDFGSRSRGARDSLYSRIQLTVRPYSDLHVLELAGKATVRNKEVYNRTYFEELENADLSGFIQRIDYWIIEFAEIYAASQ
jgi:hypothetical protein